MPVPSAARGKVAKTTSNFSDISRTNPNHVLSRVHHFIDFPTSLNKIVSIDDLDLDLPSILSDGNRRTCRAHRSPLRAWRDGPDDANPNLHEG
jgi:hypothetical protein